MPRDWLLELGHSRLKLAPLESAGRPGPSETLGAADFGSWLENGDAARGDRFELAAVPGADAVRPVTAALERAGHDWRRVTTGTPDLPVSPAYPGLGVDRWLAMQPAWATTRAAFCLVDAGTATTIDVVDDAGVHRGGWILPGAAAGRAGLLARAPGLERPAIDAGESLEPAGETAPALERGLRLQQVGAVERALREARALPGCNAPALILTGGAAATLQSQLRGARVEPDLVLRGLAMAVERARER